MLEFDEKGYLKPAANIPATLETVRTEFVLNFPTSTTRLDLFLNLILFCQKLLHLVQQNEILLWIDGSFVTKKINPADIDVVMFLDDAISQQHKAPLELFKYPRSLELFSVDAYVVNVFSENHPNHFVTRADRAHWLEWFSKTATNRYGKKMPKGFLELNISQHEIT